jgi:hypothetical protein
MIDGTSVPPVTADELLARFATQGSQFRKGDKTVKQDLFIPNSLGEVSVMRHWDATEGEIWAVGRAVASKMARTLYGRSDIQAAACQNLALTVVATPIAPDNPNHADIKGWPEKKEDQKAIAQKLAVVASKLIPPS